MTRIELAALVLSIACAGLAVFGDASMRAAVVIAAAIAATVAAYTANTPR